MIDARIFEFYIREKNKSFTIPLEGATPLSDNWHVLDVRDDGACWYNAAKKLKVIASISIELDNCLWIHTSISHRDRIPFYHELTMMKEYWIGKDRKAIMVLPEQAKHVNIHPNALHLFHCIDNNGCKLPDFTHGSQSI